MDFLYHHQHSFYMKYQKLEGKGGVLQNLGDIHKYCNMRVIGGHWHYTLREDVRVTFDDVLKEEKK